MTTRPWLSTRCTLAVAGLLSVALCGCGINIPSPAANSGADAETADDQSLASAGTVDYGMGGGGMTGMSNAMNESYGEQDEFNAEGDEEYGDEAYGVGDEDYGDVDGYEADYSAGAEMEEMYEEEGYGEFYTGDGPEDMEAMREQFERQGGLPGGFNPEDMEAMREQFERQGGLPDGFNPDDMEEMRAQFERGGRPGGEFDDGDIYSEGGRSGRGGRFEEGTAPYAVMQMVDAIDQGDLETAAKYISDNARGLLGSIRDGKTGENQLNELQSYFSTMDPLSQRPRGRSITLNFNGGQSKVLSFEVVREGREFLVKSMTVHDAQTRRRR